MERIGHYKIVSELGRGGMGVVYKAHEESLNRYVAIKVLGEHLEKDDEYVERFVREARSAAALSHPNIVQIYAISEHDGHHFFVMEYVQGTSVQRMIQSKGKLAPANAARLVLQAAAGLEDAHSQGVVHRDIKPANLMVTDRGLVKIADFGLALMGSVTSRLTATGMLMGTPGYLSPEQCLDQGPDNRTDIYSLGVTFFEMVTGTMPFRADSPLALLKLIVEVDPPDVRDLNPEVDGELRAVIAKMLAKDREQRYSSCGEVIADLQAWLEAHGEPIQSSAGAIATGMSPPPPPSEEDINTQPTVAVDSGATSPQAPSPPPAFPAAAAEVGVGTAPAPHATAPSTQPGLAERRGNTALLAAALAIFVLAAGAVAAVLTVKSGLLDGVFGGGASTIAELEDDAADAADGAADPDIIDSDPVTRTADLDGGSGEAGNVDAVAATEEPTDSARRLSPEAAGSTTAEPEVARQSAAVRGPHSTSGGRAERSTAPTSSVGTASPPRIVAPPPTATVVLAVGERLLAVEAEEYIKARLVRAGVELVDVTSIPGLEGFVNTESRPAPEQVRAALRPYARFLVPVRVDYLGERAIYYMGQRDTAHQARVNIGLVDLTTGRTIGTPSIIKVEYTQLNAGRVASEKLRRPATALVQRLPRD
jgi:serine/threonine-protein kinase